MYLACFLIVFCNTLYAQEGNDWKKYVIGSWKLEDFQENGVSPDKVKHEEVRLNFKKDGSALMLIKKEMVSDSFFTFERDNRKYLALGSMLAEVLNASRHSLELRVKIPSGIGKEIWLRFVPDDKKIELHMMLFGNWSLQDEEMKEVGSTPWEIQPVRVLNFAEDLTYSEWSDTTLKKGTWKLEGSTLVLQAGKGNKETYSLTSLGRRISLASKENSQEYYTLRKYYTSPEDLKLAFEEKKLVGESEEIIWEDSIRNADAVTVTVQPEPRRPVAEMLCDTFLSTAMYHYNDGDDIPSKKRLSISFRNDFTYNLEYGKIKESGTWSYDAGNYILIVVRNGNETIIPLNILSYGDDSGGTYTKIKTMSISLVIPGEQRLKTVYLVNE